MYFARTYFPPSYFAPSYFGGGAVSPEVLPNARRTYKVQYEGDIGTFAPYWPGETDPLTFDVSAVLDSGEAVASVSSITLLAPADPTPSARILSDPAISGTQISILLGNWMQVRYVNYLVTLTYVTSQDETLQAQGYVSVERPRSGYH